MNNSIQENVKIHKNFNKVREIILNERRKSLSQFLGVSNSEILRNFEYDLYGVLSGGEEAQQLMRRWLLLHYSPSDRTAKELSYQDISCYLDSFEEMTIAKINDRVRELKEKIIKNI